MITTIIWSVIILLIPYIVLYLIRDNDYNMNPFLFIPVINHFILLILMSFVLSQGVIKGLLLIIEIHYKKKYKNIITKKIPKNIQKEVDPYDEENWDEYDEESWIQKINNNKIYNFVKEYKV